MSIPNSYKLLYYEYFNTNLTRIAPITGSGSNRKYFRVFDINGHSSILTDNSFIEENNTFFYLSDYIASSPKILAINQDKTLYLQQDLGDEDLLSLLEKKGKTEEMYKLWEESLITLAQLQIELKNKIDYSQCYDFQCFDEKVVLNDLFYFKNYFLDRLNINYSKSKLIQDFESLANEIKLLPKDYFLYRDFQSRNIIIFQDKPYFIDFQGGMQGFIGYDLVSFLYQAKAALPEEWKEELKKSYFSVFMKKEGMSLEILEKGYSMGLIMRYFQILGAYGLRGLVERKPHFKDSLFLHIPRMRLLLDLQLLDSFPELERITRIIIHDDTLLKIKDLLNLD